MGKLIENFANVQTPADKKVLLELRHVDVKFNVRGRILNAIRDISLKIYDGESIAIVGESGSGKSVLTKTFAGMLDSNGSVSHGKIIFNDPELQRTVVPLTPEHVKMINNISNKLNEYSYNFLIADDYNAILELEKKINDFKCLTDEEVASFEQRKREIEDEINELTNKLAVLNTGKEEDKIEFVENKKKMAEANAARKDLNKEIAAKKASKIKEAKASSEYAELVSQLQKSKADYEAKVEEISKTTLPNEVVENNLKWAKEAILSFGRYPTFTKAKFVKKFLKNAKDALYRGVDLTIGKKMDKIYADITFRVTYVSETSSELEGTTIVDCAKVKYTKDWQKIRGCKIATVFQDPMTSLNPIIPIGKQIMTVILKHQKCNEIEAKKRAMDMMEKVGITNPDKRFNDYPFQYSGGMRQRIVIAIALSCQPKILICDEPTTALDVTIQAQIIRLIKKLQKELGFTTVYITHDLGVVANVADRVAVIYGGQIIEIGNVEDIFYEPAHPYTWALLSSMPQLSERGSELFSISGTPPSLYNKIKGDAFAPRNNYAMAIDFVKEPPMFEINDHHFAKTWLLDERAPKIEKPEIIQNLHEKMCKVYESKGGNENGK